MAQEFERLLRFQPVPIDRKPVYSPFQLRVMDIKGARLEGEDTEIGFKKVWDLPLEAVDLAKVYVSAMGNPDFVDPFVTFLQEPVVEAGVHSFAFGIYRKMNFPLRFQIYALMGTTQTEADNMTELHKAFGRFYNAVEKTDHRFQSHIYIIGTQEQYSLHKLRTDLHEGVLSPRISGAGDLFSTIRVGKVSR